jgi:CelD/BcsL family acetyltransferase involved in cellulose biosynthesis
MTDARGEGHSERLAPPDALAGESRVPAPFTLESLRAALERWRGRPLILVAVSMPSGRPAMWIGTACCDYIAYEPSLPPSQQVWAVARQAGHMLADHRGSAAGGDAAASLFPGLDPAVVATELPAPAAFTTAEAQEAETLAAMLVARITPTSGSDRQPAP